MDLGLGIGFFRLGYNYIMNKALKFILVLLVVVIGGVVVYQQMQIKQLKDDTTAIQAEVKKNAESIAATDRAAFFLPYSAYSLQRMAYNATTNTLYIPELKVKIPYSDLASTLLYSPRFNGANGSAGDVDVTTDSFAPPQETTQLNCTNIIRLKVEDKPNPYNPAEKATTYDLGGGKKLQVYVFSGELEGNSQCKNAYEAQKIDTQEFAKAFAGASSY